MPCTHQQPVFNIPPQNGYVNTGNVQAADIGGGIGAGAGTGAGAGAEWIAHAGDLFGQQQGSRSYLPNIVYDLSPTDEHFQPQDQALNVLNNNDDFAYGRNIMASPYQNNYSNGHQDANYSNGSSNDSPYYSTQGSRSTGSPSGYTATRTNPKFIDTQYCNSEDDKVITGKSKNRSNRQKFTKRHLEKVQKIIQETDAQFGDRHYHSS